MAGCGSAWRLPPTTLADIRGNQDHKLPANRVFQMTIEGHATPPGVAGAWGVRGISALARRVPRRTPPPGGGRLERHGLSSPTPSTHCTPTSELSPMAFLVGVRLAACPAATSRPAHHGRREMLHRRRADLLHGGARLGAQYLEHALHARLAESAETPQVRPADAHRARAHRQR